MAGTDTDAIEMTTDETKEKVPGSNDMDVFAKLHRDNDHLKSKFRQGKKYLFGMFVALTVLAVVLVVLMAVILNKQTNNSASEDTAAAPVGTSLIQALAVGQPQSPDGEGLPLTKYFLNIGLRNDYLLQECQGPQLKRSFPDMGYALLGYNVLKGYPLAFGNDPGFALPIFSADYRAGSQTADCRYSVPKGVVLIPDVSCITSFSSEVIKTAYAFSEALETSAHVSGGGWGVSFSASAGFQASTSELESGESVVIVSKASCNYYFMRLLENDAPPFHPVFLKWILKLNQSEEDDLYFEFLDNYGTHFLSEVQFGASFAYEYKMSSADFEKEQTEKIDVAASASYAGLFSVGGGFNMEDSQRTKASRFMKQVTTRTVTVGAAPPSNGDYMTWASSVKESPAPVRYTLQSIEELFSETFMGTTALKAYNIDFRDISEKIVSLKWKYCLSFQQRGILADCIPAVKMELSYISEGDIIHNVISSENCIDKCRKIEECVGITYNKRSLTCYTQRQMASSYRTGVASNGYESAVLTSKLKYEFVLTQTSVINRSMLKSDSTNAVLNVWVCYVYCMRVHSCFMFVFKQSSTSHSKCDVYQYNYDLELSLFHEPHSTTYFINHKSNFKLYSLDNALGQR